MPISVILDWKISGARRLAPDSRIQFSRLEFVSQECAKSRDADTGIPPESAGLSG